MATTRKPKGVRLRGDRGRTPLNPPTVHVSKDSPEIQVLGALQELSASLGLARSLLAERGLSDMDAMLRDVQRHLYVLKCDIASPGDQEVVNEKRVPRPEDAMVVVIDVNCEKLLSYLGTKPDRFILECGSPAATSLFLANEVARRAERLLVSPSSEALRPKTRRFGQQYLNHLSNQLYLMARVANQRLGIAEESINTDAVTGEVKVRTEPLRP